MLIFKEIVLYKGGSLLWCREKMLEHLAPLPLIPWSISLWVLVPPNMEMTPTSQDHWDDDQASQDLEDSKHHGDLQLISDSSLRLLGLESE